MHPKQPARIAPAVSLMAVLAALLFVTVVAACGDDSMPAVPTPTIAAVEEPPAPPATPTALEPVRPSPAEAVSAQSAISASTDVVTEDDLLNTTHPLEDSRAPELTGLASWIGSDPRKLSRPCRGKSSSSTSGRTRASTAFARCRSSSNGRRSTSRSVSASSASTPRSSTSRRMLRNVRAAVERLGIDYPVALDNDAETWDAFGVTAWPAKYHHRRRGRHPLCRGRGGRLRRRGADDPPLARTGGC